MTKGKIEIRAEQLVPVICNCAGVNGECKTAGKEYTCNDWGKAMFIARRIIKKLEAV